MRGLYQFCGMNRKIRTGCGFSQKLSNGKRDSVSSRDAGLIDNFWRDSG